MSTRMREAMAQRMAGLFHEPVDAWLRAMVGDRVVVDTARALLVWEPRRIIPSYAVPVSDVAAELVPDAAATSGSHDGLLHPGIPFQVHSADGHPLTVRVACAILDGAAFAPADADLDGWVLLDFDAFDAWFVEDERLVAHPRDPYHRIEARTSSRNVRIERDGRVLAETTRPTLLYETNLPTRFYLPRADVRVELQSTATRTACAYKGEAIWWSLGDGRDIAWTYPAPLHGATQLTSLVAFYDELVDVTVDGVTRPRPDGPFARVLREEFGLDALDLITSRS